MPIDDVIYDVGMNNGDDTAYYLSLGFRTVAIEANPELVKYAKARFAHEIASGRLIILNIGIADREGELPFWICETNSRWSSFDRTYASWGNSPNHQIQVLHGSERSLPNMGCRIFARSTYRATIFSAWRASHLTKSRNFCQSKPTI